MGGVGLLGDADLHGLVDGHLEVDRRAEVLRRLAASSTDRALIEAWQEQNDLIRAAFRDVERETLPVLLDLAPPRFRCIDGNLNRPQPLPPIFTPSRAQPSRRRDTIAAAATLLVVALGLAGAWLMITQGSRDDDASAVGAATVTSSSPALEAMLADRAVSALDIEARNGAGQIPVQVPDLASQGLRLTGVFTQAGEPGSLVLRYRDASDRRVALGIANASDAAMTQPMALGRTISWRRGGVAYALAGTLPLDHLRNLAQALQNELGRD